MSGLHRTPVTPADLALAIKLAHLVADLDEARRPIDRREANARLDGACLAAYALGYDGNGNENGIRLIVADYVRANPRPNPCAAPGPENLRRKQWDADAQADIGQLLANAGPNRPRRVGLQCPDCGGWGLRGCTCPTTVQDLDS